MVEDLEPWKWIMDHLITILLSLLGGSAIGAKFMTRSKTKIITELKVKNIDLQTQIQQLRLSYQKFNSSTMKAVDILDRANVYFNATGGGQILFVFPSGVKIEMGKEPDGTNPPSFEEEGGEDDGGS